MNTVKHREKALRIERSLQKLPKNLHELRIEAAMLAGTHWLNSILHQCGATNDAQDVLHTYMLTINEYRRLSVYAPNAMKAMSEIEDLRPLYVRGDVRDGQDAADQAERLCAILREMAQ